ncbi:MAG: sialidase family protein [Bryobacteraceae bacterium]
MHSRVAGFLASLLYFSAVSAIMPGSILLMPITVGSAASQSLEKGTGRTLALAEHLDYVSPPPGAPAREPMIIELPDGTLFVSGYGSPKTAPPQTVPRLWKSVDRGATWTGVNVGGEADGAIGNSDVDLAVARDGTVYFVTMGFDNKTLEGTHIAVAVSQDAGKTWHWTMLSKKRFDDRPWVAAAPDGTAHVIWNDGSGVYHAVSRDRGISWSTRRIYSDGGSSHLAIGPKGEIAVRIVPISASGNRYKEGVDLILVSTDGGDNWMQRPVPGRRDWAPLDARGAIPRWVEPLAWDAGGALYLLWTDVKGVWLGRSSDGGEHWSEWRVAETDALSYYPYLSAGGAGQLAATWYSGAGESLHWQAARIEVANGGGPPHFLQSSLLRTESWSSGEGQGNVPVRDTAGEYLAALLLKDGDLAVVTPIQNAAGKRFGFSFWRFKGRP